MLILSIITTLVGLVTFLALTMLHIETHGGRRNSPIERVSKVYMLIVALLLLWHGIAGMVGVWG